MDECPVVLKKGAGASVVTQQQGDAWAFGVLLCTLALHLPDGRGNSRTSASRLCLSAEVATPCDDDDDGPRETAEPATKHKTSTRAGKAAGRFTPRKRAPPHASQLPSPPPSPPMAAGAATEGTGPASPSPYVTMLRLCQGQLSPLDGVSLTLCPKALHRLAEQCCEREGVKRPDLTNLAAQLQGPVLHQLDPDTLQARRPATRLCGWRAAAEAANPALVRQRSEPAASDQTGVARSLFETYDADGSATLDASELRQLCLSMGREMTVDEAEATLKALDLDGSGDLSYDEFLLWWAQGLSVSSLHEPPAKRKSVHAAKVAAACATARSEVASASSDRDSCADEMSRRRSARRASIKEAEKLLAAGEQLATKERPGRMTCRKRSTGSEFSALAESSTEAGRASDAERSSVTERSSETDCHDLQESSEVRDLGEFRKSLEPLEV